MNDIKKDRITGYDFARALSILGMIIVNYKLALNAEGKGPDWLIFISNIFDGRAAATFVTLAGVGVSLMTLKARQINTPDMINQERMHLIKRAIFLLTIGLAFYTVWPADILHYYGFYMLAAAFMFDLPDKALLYLSIAANTAYSFLLLLLNYNAGWADGYVYVDFWSAKGFLRNLFYNGFHPILPWITFMLIGLWLGRQNLQQKEVRERILKRSVPILVVSEILSAVLVRIVDKMLINKDLAYLFDTLPMPPNILYILAASSLAVSVICISVDLTERLKNNKIIKAFIKTGQMSLTHYIGHVIVGLGLLELLSCLKDQTLMFSVFYSILIFLMIVLFSVIWSKKSKRGPLEYIMRRLTD